MMRRVPAPHEVQAEPGFTRFEGFLDEWSRRDVLKAVGIGSAYLAFLSGGVGLLEACSASTTGGGPSAGTPQKGGTLIEGWSTEPSYLLPARAADVYSNIANRLLFEGLITVDKDGNPQPNFAQKLPEVSSDSLTYTFKLRSDIKWSDGSPLTPDDVVATYELYYDPKYEGLLGNNRPTLKRYIKSATAQGDTIVLQSTSVYAPFLLQTGLVPIVPKKYIAGKTGVQLNTDEFNSAPPVSNGKFKFVSWTKGDKLILARNDSYFRGPVNLDQWIYKKVPDAVAVLQQLKTGEIDVGRLDPSSYDEAKAQPNLNVLSFPTWGWDELIFQHDPDKPAGQILQDKQVRQALMYGLDRKAIVQASYFGQATVADSILPPSSWAFNKDVKPKYTYDPKKAGELLDAAGWKLGSAGVREKGGQKLSFEMVTNADNSTRVKNLQILQEQWKKIGVDAQIRNMSNLGLLGDNLAKTRQFGAMFIGFSLQPFGEPDQSGLWHSRQAAPGGNNGGLFKNPAVDKILDDAVATLDRSKRKQLYYQLQDILADELPSCIIAYSQGIYGVNKRVHSYGLGTFWLYGYGNSPFMKDVWVEAKK